MRERTDRGPYWIVSDNLFKNFVSHYPLSSQKTSLTKLIPRTIKVASIWFPFTFTVKSLKHVVLWWREHIFQSKFKDDIESLNTDDVLSVILKIYRENAMKPNFNLKFDVSSNTFYLWIGILRTCIHTKMTFFYANQSQKEKQLATMRMPF